MHDRPPRRRRAATSVRLVLSAAAALVAMAVMSAPARADTAVNVIGDSVLVTGQPAGAATIRATRPDALTGNPVVIGLFSGQSDGVLPLTVNTTNATALDPDGDCWQQGALLRALTPDIRPGDSVTVTGDPSTPGGATSTSVLVPADDGAGTTGPISSCGSIAPFASNAVTGAPATATGPIAVSGTAQPFATGVAISATDGSHSTVPVPATPGADGTWSATIPAAQADTLANGPVTVGAVFAVPDVATGAPAHIAGAPIVLQMARAAAPAAGATAGTGAPRATRSAKRPVAGDASGPSRISLSRAGGGLRASLVVAKGTRVLDVRLLRGKRTLVHRVVPARTPGTRQTVVLTRKAPGRGRYTVAVRSGPSRAQLGAPVLRTILVR
ncbi:MAG: hypothetical protein QOH72_3259 [Solirubrobacteraceae bacterium]|nr:hypothetical protein [Solirubrobacteraceae bacterium]